MWIWGENNGKIKSWGTLLGLQHFGVEGHVGAPRWARKNDKHIIHSHEPAQNQTTSWLVHSWSIFGGRTSHERIRIHKTHHGRTWGKPHLPPYSILCAWPQDPHPNVILSHDSQMGVPKFPQLGLLQLWWPIILRADLWLIWGLKKSCSPFQDISNGMSQDTYMLGNRGDSWLLVVESQIANLTLRPSFGHILCLKCPNGSCEPILDI